MRKWIKRKVEEKKEVSARKIKWKSTEKQCGIGRLK